MSKPSWIHKQFFTNPGFMGWQKRPCSKCGRKHPSYCGIVQQPEYRAAAAHYGFQD